MVCGIAVFILVSGVLNDRINNCIGRFFGGCSFCFANMAVSEPFRNLNGMTACFWQKRRDAPRASCRIKPKLPVAGRSPKVG